MSSQVYASVRLEQTNLSVNQDVPESKERTCIPLSGIRGELLRILVERGVLDPFGKICDSYANFTLPPLTEEEVTLIQEELQKHFPITLDGEWMVEISMERIFEYFRMDVGQQRPDLYIRSSRLIGSYVSYLLFVKTDYAKRVFHALDLGEAYDERLFPKEAKEPADIDLRMHVEKRPLYMHGMTYHVDMQREDLQTMRDLVTWRLSYEFPRETPLTREEIQTKIYDQAFSELCTIDKGFIQMQLLSFKESPIDWILYHQLPRASVFTLDDLYLTLDFSNPVALESHRGKALESFFHHVLGFIDAENITTIDEKGWFRYLRCLSKGNWVIYRPSREEEPELEAYLFSLMRTVWHGGLSQIEWELAKWIEKHNPDDPLGAAAFLLNLCLHLHGRFEPEEIVSLLRRQLGRCALEDSNLCFTSIKALICDDGVDLANLVPILKLAALQDYLSAEAQEGVLVEVGTEAFLRPLFQLTIGGHSIQLNLEIVQALSQVAEIDDEELSRLARFYFRLSPPRPGRSFPEELGLDQAELEECAETLIKSKHPFLLYLGVMILWRMPSTSAASKQRLAERHALSILKLENREELRELLNYYIGKEGLPPLDEKRFEEKWVERLFAYGRNSEKVAMNVWSQLPRSPSTFSLIEKLAHHQPAYALRLFLQSDLERFPSESFLSMLSIVEAVKKTNQTHEPLYEWMQKQIPLLLNHPNFSAPPLLPSGFEWFASRDSSLQLTRWGAEQQWTAGSPKKACRRRLMLSQVRGFLDVGDYQKVEKELKRAVTENLLKSKEMLELILELYDKSSLPYDLSLGSALATIGQTALPDEAQRLRIIEILAETIESKGAKEALSLLHASFPRSLGRKLCMVCAKHQIPLPKSMNVYWYETLADWVEDENPDYDAIYELYSESKRQQFPHHDALIEVKLALAEARRDFTLLRELVRFLPGRVNQERFYSVLEQLVTVDNNEIWQVLSQIARKDSQPYPQSLYDRVISICSSGDLAKQVKWLTQTGFFQGLQEKEGFHQLVEEVVKTWILHADKSGITWEMLYEFFQKYPLDLCAITTKTWFQLRLILLQKEPTVFPGFYIFLGEHEILQEESPVFFLFYSSALEVIVRHQLPLVILAIDKHARMCAAQSEPVLALRAHALFLCAYRGCPRNLFNEEGIQLLYRDAKALIQTEEVQNDPECSKEGIALLESEIDFHCLHMLIKTKNLDHARTCLNEIIEVDKHPAFWKNTHLLIHSLIDAPDGIFLPEILQLLKFTTGLFPLEYLHSSAVIDLLIKYPSEQGHLSASTLLQNTLYQGLRKLDKETWDQLKHLTITLIRDENWVEAMQLVFFWDMNSEAFEKEIGSTFTSEALNLAILYWSKCTDPQYTDRVAAHLLAAINLLPKLSNPGIDGLNFPTIANGLCNLSRMDSQAFAMLTNKYMNTIYVRQHVKLTGMLALKADDCFLVKQRFIEKLIETLTPDHPHTDTLKDKIGICIQAIRKEEFFKGKTEEIKALLRSYVEAVKRL